MYKRVQKDEWPSEPIGIVISRGRTAEAPPRFSAFIWGPVPEAELESTTTATKAA